MKGVKVSNEQKEEVLRLYSTTKSYAEIEAATGVSKAAVSGIVNEATAGDPDLLSVRKIVQYCREKGVAAESLLRGTAVEERLEEAGSSIEQVEAVVLPLIKQAKGNVVEYCKNGMMYSEVVETTGLTYPQLVSKQQRLARDVDKRQKNVENLESSEKSLEQKIESLTSTLAHLNDLETISAALKHIKKSPSEAAGIIQKSEELWKRGLSVNVMDGIAAELEKHTEEPRETLRRIAELVGKYGSLEAATRQKTNKLDAMKRKSEKLRSGISKLQGEYDSMERDKKDLSVNLDKLQKEYNSLSERFRQLEERFESRSVEVKKGLDLKTSELVGLNRRISESTATNSTLMAQRDTLKLLIAAMEAKRKALGEDLAELEKAKSRTQTELEEARSRTQTELEEARSRTQRELGNLKFKVGNLQRSHSDKVKRCNAEKSRLADDIGLLNKQIADLSVQKADLDDLIGKSAESLAKVEKEVSAKRSLFVLVTIMNDPQCKLEPSSALEPVIVLLTAMRDYISYHASEVAGSRELSSLADQLTQGLAGVVRAGNR